MASAGPFSCIVSKINAATTARFYYENNGNEVSIFVVSNMDYSITNITPLLERGGCSYHLTKETLPEGAIAIPIS